MKKLAFIVFLALIGKVVFAQTSVVFPYSSMIEKGDFVEAEKKIMEIYSKDSTDAINCYAAYSLYASEKNPNRNLEKAHSYILRCADIYNSLDAKGKAKCEKKNLNNKSLQSAVSAIEFRMAKNVNTVEAYQQFIDNQPVSKETDEAKQLRNALAYRQTVAENTIEAYERFINAYPSAKEADAALFNVHNIAYRNAEAINTEQSYRDYIKKYPFSPFAE